MRDRNAIEISKDQEKSSSIEIERRKSCFERISEEKRNFQKEKFTKKIDLDLDNIEEMPVSFEFSSKKIDSIENNLNQSLMDSIKETNSNDRIKSIWEMTNSKKKYNLSEKTYFF